MTKRDKRISILGGELDRDIPRSKLLALALGDKKNDLLNQKLLLLVQHYKIDVSDTTACLLELALRLAHDCVKGFRFVEKSNPKHRPKILYEWDWLELAKDIKSKIDNGTANSRTAACMHIINAGGSKWKRYSPVSLESALRREVAKAKKQLSDNAPESLNELLGGVRRELISALN